MIPITADERFRWTDEESGITFIFKPKTGSTENRMLWIQAKYFDVVYRDKLNTLKKLTSKYQNNFDSATQEDVDKIQTLQFNILTIDSMFYAEIVDLFLCGWENTNAKFPEDGKPSECFTKEENKQLASVAIEQNKLSVMEKKSS